MGDCSRGSSGLQGFWGVHSAAVSQLLSAQPQLCRLNVSERQSAPSALLPLPAGVGPASHSCPLPPLPSLSTPCPLPARRRGTHRRFRAGKWRRGGRLRPPGGAGLTYPGHTAQGQCVSVCLSRRWDDAGPGLGSVTLAMLSPSRRNGADLIVMPAPYFAPLILSLPLKACVPDSNKRQALLRRSGELKLPNNPLVSGEIYRSWEGCL